MYSARRTKEWIRRSNAPEYQAAYDVIAEHVKELAGEVVTEIFCGSGNLLNRLSQQGRQVVIGTDASPRMLDVAASSLRRRGLVVEKERQPSKFNRSRRGVILMEDNALEMNIPPRVSDITIAAFPPEDLNVRTMDLIERQDYMNYRQAGISDDTAKAYIAGVRLFEQLRRLTVVGGTVMLALYDSVAPNDPDPKNKFEYNGLDLKSYDFFENEGVWSDTAIHAERNSELLRWKETNSSEWRSLKKGFRIVKYHTVA